MSFVCGYADGAHVLVTVNLRKARFSCK